MSPCRLPLSGMVLMHLALTHMTAVCISLQGVGLFQAEPLQYSYWLAANLPLHDDARQALLEARTAAARLRLEIKWLSSMATLHCIECEAKVGAWAGQGLALCIRITQCVQCCWLDSISNVRYAGCYLVFSLDHKVTTCLPHW